MSDKYRTVSELLKKGQSNSVYFTFLFLSAIIIASGLLLQSIAIVIGGMLVAPILTPVLVIGLGFSVGEINSIKPASILLLKSVGVITAVSFVVAIIFGGNSGIFIFENTLRAAFLYFFVALASGIAATFAWVHREANEILPGIAVSVSLVPPLSYLGIALSHFNWPEVQISFLMFLLNVVGIIVGSLVIFTLLKFSRLERIIHEESKKQIK